MSIEIVIIDNIWLKEWHNKIKVAIRIYTVIVDAHLQIIKFVLMLIWHYFDKLEYCFPLTIYKYLSLKSKENFILSQITSYFVICIYIWMYIRATHFLKIYDIRFDITMWLKIHFLVSSNLIAWYYISFLKINFVIELFQCLFIMCFHSDD